MLLMYITIILIIQCDDLFAFAAQYFASTMIIVGLSVVVTVIVLQYHHHDPDGGKMPKWVRFDSGSSILIHSLYKLLD